MSISAPAPRQRIAVIGGGIAGCVAARRLHDLGHTDVTLFEAENRIGGKLYTRMLDGVPHEMGAVALLSGYSTALPLARRLGVALVNCPYLSHYDITQRKLLQPKITFATLRQLWAFRRYLVRHAPDIATPAALACDPTLHQPFTQWAQAMGFPLVPAQLIDALTCMGYGHPDDIPAFYVLRYLNLLNFNSMLLSKLWSAVVPARFGLKHPFLQFAQAGIQGLAEALVAGIDVRLGAAVTRITRDGSYALTIGDAAGPERFDAVVFAVPPAGIAGLDVLLPLAVQEAVARLRTRDYTTMLCRIDGIATGGYCLDLANGIRVAPGPDRIALVTRANPGSNGCVLYHLGDAPVSDAALRAMAEAAAALLRGTLVEIIETRRWNYFPHFDATGLAHAPFATFAAAQGVDRLYFVGAYLDFEVMENTVVSALRVIDEHFAPAVAKAA